MAKTKNFSMANTFAFGSLRECESQNPIPSAEPLEKNENNEIKKIAQAEQSSEKAESKTKTTEIKTKTVSVKSNTPIKSTSVSIHRNALNYLAYMAKLSPDNQNDYLASLLNEERASSNNIKPDFNAVRTKRDTVDMVVKGIKLPEDIFQWVKERAAMEMKSVSEYIDDLLLDKMSKM